MNAPAEKASRLILDREAALIAKYEIIEDVQERLLALSSRRPQVPTVPEENRRDENLVRGCSSPVWITGKTECGLVFLAMTSPTPLVASLAGILCDLCHGASRTEILAWHPTWLDSLRINRFLSEARQRGLQSVLQRIREIAAGAER